MSAELLSNLLEFKKYNKKLMFSHLIKARTSTSKNNPSVSAVHKEQQNKSSKTFPYQTSPQLENKTK